MPKPVGIALVSLGKTGACQLSQPQGMEPLSSFQLPKIRASAWLTWLGVGVGLGVGLGLG